MSSPPGPARRRHPPALLVAALAVGALGVLAAAAGGPWRLRDRFGLWSGAPAPVAPPRPPPSSAASALPRRPPAVTSTDWLAPLVWTVAVLVVLALAYLVWRRLPRRSRRDRGVPLGASASAGGGGEPSAPVLRAGLGEARHLLDTVLDPTDAVLAAWVALEQAAERSGVARRPADTPTELTAAVLGATPADASAVRLLLALYHRARFSAGGVDPGAVQRARRCVDALAASWSGFSAAEAAGPGRPAPEPPAPRWRS